MDQTMLNSYASLLIRSGLNVRNGQLVVISSPVDCAEFTRLLVRQAYDAGASAIATSVSRCFSRTSVSRRAARRSSVHPSGGEEGSGAGGIP